MAELWLPVVGYENYYKVSNLGKVISLRSGRLLKQWPNIDGYPQVGLCVNYKKKHFRVHRLVLETFAGSCPAGCEARHYPDQDKNNCRLDNLSWATTAVNIRDNTDRGVYYLGRLSDEMVREIRTIELPYGTKNAYCQRIGIARSTFHQIRRHAMYAHVGE